MVLELFSFGSDDTFNYGYDMPSAEDLSWSSDGRSLFIKSGVEIEKEYVDAFNSDTLTSAHGWLCHVSDQANEFIFHMQRKANGGSITHYISGDSNSHIYIITGITGQRLKVKRKFHYIGVDETAKHDLDYFSDSFGDVLFGQITPDTFKPKVGICELLRQTNKISRYTGSDLAWRMQCPSIEHSTDPDYYRRDQMNPFWVGWEHTTETPEKDMLTLRWAGGGAVHIRALTTLKEIKIMVCEWID